MNPFLSIVIPAYNEAKNFRAGLLRPAFDYLAAVKYSYEVIFVNDGSTDDSEKLLKTFCQRTPDCRLLTISHGGKAAAVRTGIFDAKGEFILFTDFDQSTPLSQVEKFIDRHRSGADVVIGIRGGEGKTKKDTVFRRFRSASFVALVQLVLLPGISDTQCGFKSFSKKSARRIFKNLKVTFGGQVTGGYMGAFDVEALFLGRKFNYRIAQVRVDWVKILSEKLNPWKEPLKMLYDVIKIRAFDILGKYKSA